MRSRKYRYLRSKSAFKGRAKWRVPLHVFATRLWRSRRARLAANIY